MRLLDLFCGSGGCARGYQLAGFECVGVDFVPQKHYIGENFVLMNAIAALDVLLCGGAITDTSGRAWQLADFAAIHASPPCQGYSIMRNLPWLRGKEYTLLIAPTRAMLQATGKPYVIENVMGARYRPDTGDSGMQAGWLCGTMFGLPFYRHRLFETPFDWLQPGHQKHEWRIRPRGSLGGRARDIVFEGAYGTWPGRRGDLIGVGHGPGSRTVSPHGITAWVDGEASQYGHTRGKQSAQEAMGIDWRVTGDELSQMIPPTYTSYIGSWLLRHIEGG